MPGANDGTFGPFHHIAYANTAEREGGFHGDAGMIVHPAYRVVGIVDDNRRQQRVAASTGDAREVLVEIIAGVGLHAGSETG